jgi:hypothetical protein
MQCAVEIDTQPCSAGEYGSVLLISSPAMSCQVISRPRFRGFGSGSESRINAKPETLNVKTGVYCQHAWGKRYANASGSQVLGKYPA